VNTERLEKILAVVRDSTSIQANFGCRENYLRSCEAHGGETAEAAKIVRQEFSEAKIGKE